MSPRRVRQRNRASVTVLVALVVLLSGCARASLESEYRADGSARHTFEATIDRTALQAVPAGQAGALGIFTDEEGNRARAEALGLEFEQISTDERVGPRVSRTFEDGGDVGASFSEILAAVAPDGADRFAGTVAGTFRQEGDGYQLDLTIDTSQLLGDLADNPALGQFGSLVDITYTARMPGDISETNGVEVDDTTARWNLPLAGTTRMTATSSASSSDGGSSPIVLIVLVALLIGGGLAAGLLFVRR